MAKFSKFDHLKNYSVKNFNNLFNDCQKVSGAVYQGKKPCKEAVEKVEIALKSLDKELEGKTWLENQTLTNRDILCFIAVKDLFATTFGPEFRLQIPSLTAWFKRVSM